MCVVGNVHAWLVCAFAWMSLLTKGFLLWLGWCWLVYKHLPETCSLAIGVALGMNDVWMSVALDNNRMQCHNLINSYSFGDPLTFPLAPPAGQNHPSSSDKISSIWWISMKFGTQKVLLYFWVPETTMVIVYSHLAFIHPWTKLLWYNSLIII